MRKLILKMSITLDGFCCGLNNEQDWVFSTGDDQSKAWVKRWVDQAGVHAMGSGAYGDMAPYWPTSTDVFADAMNRIPKVVFSRSGAGKETPKTKQALDKLAKLDKGGSWIEARWMIGDLAASVAKLKAEPGGPIVAYGGAALAQALVAADLIDEYVLPVHPVAIGKGKPLFGESARRDLRLESVVGFPKGTVGHHYVRVR